MREEDNESSPWAELADLDVEDRAEFLRRGGILPHEAGFNASDFSPDAGPNSAIYRAVYDIDPSEQEGPPPDEDLRDVPQSMYSQVEFRPLVPWRTRREFTALSFSKPSAVPAEGHNNFRPGHFEVSKFYLGHSRFDNLYDAISFANSQGMIMNQEFTLTLGVVGEENEVHARSRHATFMEWLRKWHEHRGLPKIYVFVWEHSLTFGWHVHMQLYVPDDKQAEFSSWLNKAVPSLASCASHYHRKRRIATVVSQWFFFRYIIKSLHPGITIYAYWEGQAYCIQLIRILGLRGAPPFRMSGDRCGVSMAIGPSSRSKAGFKPVVPSAPYTFSRYFSDEAYQRHLDAVKAAEHRYIMSRLR